MVEWPLQKLIFSFAGHGELVYWPMIAYLTYTTKYAILKEVQKSPALHKP
jgi:hypothetical protein